MAHGRDPPLASQHNHELLLQPSAQLALPMLCLSWVRPNPELLPCSEPPQGAWEPRRFLAMLSAYVTLVPSRHTLFHCHLQSDRKYLMSPSRAPFSGELQMPPLLLLILHPFPSQVNLSIPFGFSPNLLNRRTPRIIFAAGAAGGNVGCLQQGKRNKMLGSFFQLPGPR